MTVLYIFLSLSDESVKKKYMYDEMVSKTLIRQRTGLLNYWVRLDWFSADFHDRL